MMVDMRISDLCYTNIFSLIENAQCVVATSNGNSYGLTIEEQLSAIKMSVDNLHNILMKILETPNSCDECFLKSGCDMYENIDPCDCNRLYPE